MAGQQNLKIDYIEFPAADLKSVECFYSAVFGWKFTWYGDAYLAFSDGQMDGGFFKTEAAPCPQSDNPHGVGTLVIMYSGDLEHTRDAVVAAGATLSKDIFEFPGGRRFQFLDPAGNELSVWSEK
ncbi:MAG: VOC family protein [Aureliella sp.]